MAQETKHYDTIIIGAGVSGLACASRLYQHPRFQNPGSLLVLEARDRIGGRVNAVHVNGCRLDTGANWIHGVGTKDEPNPLVSILPHKRYRELSGMVAFRHPVEGKDQTRDDDWVVVNDDRLASESTATSQESSVIPTKIATPLYGSLWGLIGSLHDVAVETPSAGAKKTTMLQAIAKSGFLQDAAKELPEEYHRTLGALPQFIENMEAAPLAAQSAESAKGQPGMGLLEFAIDDFDGEQVFLQDGYLAVIDEIAKDLVKDGIVELGKEAEQVRYDGPKQVVIKTSTGTYSARRVVCTLPLGVLQHKLQPQAPSASQTPLFAPTLPSDKLEAIESLGFGTLDKIFLVYSHPWWTEEPYSSILREGITKRLTSSNAANSNESTDEIFDTLMGFTADLSGIEIDLCGTPHSGLRVLFCINLHSLTGFPVLSTFVSCSNAQHIESLSNEAAGSIVHRALTQWLGREPPTPDTVHVTRWAQDEFSRGSYSHMIAGLSETRHREAFQRPVVGEKGAVVRFAGEHTSRNHFATVHGALLSGWREADEILKR